MNDDTDTCIYLLILIGSALFGWYVLGPLFYNLGGELPSLVNWTNRQLGEWARRRRSRNYTAIYRRAVRFPIDYHYAVRRLTAQTAYTAVAFRSIGLSADEAVKAFQRVADALSQHMQEKM